jgi:hypothetical protein
VPIKRLKYFTHQFLREQDFEAEQKYHTEMRRRHNRHVHGWGVVEGLTVRKRGEFEIVVEPGVAIDREGREIILEAPVIRDLSAFERNSHTYITISYGEEWDDGDRYSSGGIEGYTRVTETPLLGEKRTEPARDGAALILARVRINENGHVQEPIEGSLRTMFRKGGATSGWVRLAFKPQRLEITRIGDKLAPPREWDPGTEFIIDHASAYCEKNAWGTMQIPVPPGASRVTALRVCGHTRGQVDVEVVRGGWNLEARRGEAKAILKRVLKGDSFDDLLEVTEGNQMLGELHTLSLVLNAEGRTEIWLVAANFE